MKMDGNLRIIFLFFHYIYFVQNIVFSARFEAFSVSTDSIFESEAHEKIPWSSVDVNHENTFNKIDNSAILTGGEYIFTTTLASQGSYTCQAYFQRFSNVKIDQDDRSI